MTFRHGQSKSEASTFMKVVLVAVLFLLPATSSASDDIRELGKAAEKIARAYNVDDALNDLFFGGFRGRTDFSGSASQSGGTSHSSAFKDKTKSKFTIKGLSKIEYKYGDHHRVIAADDSITYHYTISLW